MPRGLRVSFSRFARECGIEISEVAEIKSIMRRAYYLGTIIALRARVFARFYIIPYIIYIYHISRINANARTIIEAH